MARAKGLAEDLLVVLRIEYAKARGDQGQGGYQGYQQQQQQQYGQQQAGDPYAGYYQVCHDVQSPPGLHLDSRIELIDSNNQDRTVHHLKEALHRRLAVRQLVELLLLKDQKHGLNMLLIGQHTVTMSMIHNVSSRSKP